MRVQFCEIIVEKIGHLGGDLYACWSATDYNNMEEFALFLFGDAREGCQF